MLFVVVDSDWLAWLYPSPYTAAHRFRIVIMVLDGVFMRDDVKDNFFFNNVVCCVIFENGGGEIFISLNTLLCINVDTDRVRVVQPIMGMSTISN